MQWENLEVRPCESCCRSFAVIVLMLIAMALSFTGIYLIRVYQNSLPALENCENYKSVTLDTLSSTASDEETQCVCSREGYWTLLTDSQVNDKCQTFIDRTVYENLIAITASLVVAVVNFLLKFILKKMAKFERFASIGL